MHHRKQLEYIFIQCGKKQEYRLATRTRPSLAKGGGGKSHANKGEHKQRVKFYNNYSKR